MLCCGQKLTLKPKNAIRIYFQGGGGHVYCYDIWWPVSDYADSSFFPLKSAPRVLILLENINIFAICDQSEIMECSGTGHIMWETGHTNLWPVLRDCVHFMIWLPNSTASKERLLYRLTINWFLLAHDRRHPQLFLIGCPSLPTR